MGFEVLVAELADSAQAIAQAAEAAIGADLASPAEQIATALPGSRSHDTAGRLAGTWRERLTGWAESAGQHADALTGAARDYQAQDEAARDDLNRQLPAQVPQ